MAKYLDATGLSILWSTCKSSFLSTSGGVISGAIKRLYSVASDDPVLNIASVDKDIWIWRVSDSTYGIEARYGFGLKYLGTGGGNANALGLYSDDCTGTQVQVFYLTQDGIMQFNKQVKFANTSSAPFAVSSSTVVSNLNADLLDGKEASAFSLTSHNHDSTYLKLSGGSLSGDLTVNSSILFKGSGIDDGTFPSRILRTANGFQIAAANNGSKTPITIGWRNDTNQAIYIDSSANVGISTSSPSQKLEVNGNIKADSFVKKNGTSSQFLKADGSVDSSSYSLSSHTHSYLPLTGGTITGTLESTGTKLIATNQTYDTSISLFSSQNVGIWNEKTSSWILKFDGSWLYRNDKKIWDEGNLTPSDYLPKSGGTVTNTSSHCPLTIKGTNEYSSIEFRTNGGVFRKFGIKSDGNLFTTSISDWSSEYLILHSGNYTSYTVKKDGTGASGTWGINVTGSAKSLSRVDYTPAGDTVADYKAALLASTLSSSNGNWTTVPYYFVHRFDQDSESAVGGGWYSMMTIGGYQNTTWNQYLISCHGGLRLGVIERADNEWRPGIRWIAYTSDIPSTMAWSSITGKPDTYTPATHNHDSDYLKLSGGTLTNTGEILTLNTPSSGDCFLKLSRAQATSWKIGVTGGNLHFVETNSNTDLVTFYENSQGAKVSVGGQITATKFIKSGGTSSQFLKADGSVDSNSYSTTSHTHSYLPLSGGTLSGDLTIGAKLLFTNSSLDDGIWPSGMWRTSVGLQIAAANNGARIPITLGWRNDSNPAVYIDTSANVGIGTTSPSQALDVNGSIKGSSFIKSGGTSSQFLKADGSVDSNSYSLSSHNHDGAYVGRNNDVIPGYIHSSFANNQECGFIISQADNANTMKFTAGSSSHNVGLYCPQLGWMCYLPNGATDINQAVFAGTASNANTLGGYSASSFLTSHQSVSGTFWGNSWTNGGSINGTLNGAVSITSGTSTNPLLNITRVYAGTDYISMYVTATHRPLVLQMDAGNVGIGVAQPSNKLEVNGNVKADSFIKKDGTSSQFLKADGSVDSNSYSTTSHNHNSSYVSSLGTSGDSLVWTKNGTDNTITVPFSSKTHHIAPRTYSPADNSVGAHKAALVTLISNYQDGFGDCVKIPYYVVQNWDNDSATSGGGGSYLMTKLDGYSGSSYSEYLLSCHALINLGVVGRNGNEWTQIKWLAFKSDNVASASQLYTARTLTVGSTGKTFNGTEDVSWSLSEIGAAASNHNHNGTYLKLDGSSIMSDNLVINFGDTDKFVVFTYTGESSPSRDSWRTGVLGSGSGETNYYVVQYQTVNTGSSTWNTAYTIGQSTGTVTFTNNISINGNTNLHSGNHTSLTNTEIDNIMV